MRKINVEVFEDRSRPEGGHAVILLHGLASVPTKPVVRIRPIEGEQSAEAAAQWSGTDRAPIATRQTERGVEMVIGPDVVENPLLLPGTATMIEVAAASVRGEVLWPNVAPLARPKRRHLAIARPLRKVEALPEASVGEAKLDVPTVATLVVSSTVVAPMPAATTEAPALPAPDAGAAAVAAALAAATQALDATLRTASSAPSTEPAARPTTSAAAADAQTTGADAPAPQSPTDSPAAAAEAGLPKMMRPTEQRPAPPASDADGVVWLRHRAERRWSWQPIAAVVSAVAALGYGYYAFPRIAAPDAGAARPTLFSALYPTVVSPRGVDIRDAGRGGALERADGHLNGPPGRRDTEEAAFWLRQHLVETLGEQRNSWALTQLGSALVEPAKGKPDYASARQLWEMAGAFGDPVAMCFLGMLHERGLGTKPDKAQALTWFQRAKQAGGCSGDDAALARLRK